MVRRAQDSESSHLPKHTPGFVDYITAGVVGVGAATAAAIRTVQGRFFEDTKRGSEELAAMQKRYETTLREAWKSGNGAEIISKIAKEKARNLEERAKYFEAKGIASRGWRGLTKGTMQRMQMMGYENSIPKVVIASTISGVVAAGAILTFFNNRHARHTLDELKIEVDALEEDRKSRVMAR